VELIRTPLFAGFLIYTGGLVGLATIQPRDGLRCLIFAGLAGLGFGAPLVKTGLPADQVSAFISALRAQDATALSAIPELTPPSSTRGRWL
jgi:hypothetical protein